MRLRTAAVALGVMTWASAASADVKMVATMSGKMMGRTPSGQTVTYIKGNRMRTDQALGGNELSTIMDVDAGELISINHKKKEAEIWNVAEMARTLQAAGVAADGVKVSMKPNGQTKTVAGYPAVGHDLDVSVQSSMAQGMTMTVNISGPAFLSTEAPGAKDYAAFYLNAAEKGFFFGDPRAARAQPGNAKGMMTLYKTMAEKGVPLESMQVIKLSGDGPMAGVFAKMGGGEMNTTVTSISDEPIDDAVFAVPAGYTVKRQKVE